LPGKAAPLVDNALWGGLNRSIETRLKAWGAEGVRSTYFAILSQGLNGAIGSGRLNEYQKQKLLGAVEFLSWCRQSLDSEISDEAKARLAAALTAAFGAGCICGIADDKNFQEIIAQAISERGAAGGRKSGEQRRLQRPWTERAKELAKAEAKSNRRKNWVAQKILENWKPCKVAAPGLQALSKYVQELADAGEISIQQRTSSLPSSTGSRG
jgi:hypothetical protein